MLKTAEQLDAEIKILDRDIEGRERRLSMVRRHREQLYLQRATLDAPPADKFAERNGSALEKKRGKCVVEVAHDGVKWEV
jgi:hypothetical protein